MATHKQAEKRHRQSLKRRTRNIHVRSQIKTVLKNLRVAIDKKDPKQAVEALKLAIPALDKAVGKGIIPRARASRQISRLSAAVHQLGRK